MNMLMCVCVCVCVCGGGGGGWVCVGVCGPRQLRTVNYDRPNIALALYLFKFIYSWLIND